MKRFLSTVSILLIGWAILSVSWPEPAAAGTSFGVNRIRYVDATGDSEENCQSLRDTLSSITDNDFFHRYLVRLEPGLYICGDQPVVVGAYIALVGSGAGHTEIVGSIANNLVGVVHLVGHNTMLRDLTVHNNGVFAAEQKEIGVSINTVFSSGTVTQISLRDVIVNADDLVVYANDANLEVWSSRFHLGSVQNDGMLNASFNYTILPGVQGTGHHNCWHSGTGSTEFDHNCQPLP